MRKFPNLRTFGSSSVSGESRPAKCRAVRSSVRFQAVPPEAGKAEKRIRHAQDKFNHIQGLIECFHDVSFTKKIYDLWSDDYDRDMLALHYRAPEYVASVLKYDLEVELDAKILDLACGTGLVGKELKQLQYVNVHGVDTSRDMTAQAEQKDCYKSCRVINSLACIQDSFDVVIICSAFGRGHIFLDSVGLLTSLIASNAHLIVAQLSSEENLENKPLQEFVGALARRLGAPPARIEPIERYISGRFGLIGIVST